MLHLCHMDTQLPRIPRSKSTSQKEMKWELPVTTERSERSKIWIIEAKNIICLHQMVRKEWQEVGQAGVLFLRCHFPQSVGPGTSHWVIYSLGFPIDQSRLPSIAEVLWFQMWAPSLGVVRIRSRALDLQHGSPGHFSNSCFLISPTWGFILEAFSSGKF